LYFIIASTALASGMVPGAALSYPLGIISIMNRIVITPLSKPSLFKNAEMPQEPPQKDEDYNRGKASATQLLRAPTGRDSS
jgi:hypothetical protein